MYFNFSTLNRYESKLFFFLYYSCMYLMLKTEKKKTEGSHGSRLSESQPYGWLQHWEIMNSASSGKPRDVLFFLQDQDPTSSERQGLVATRNVQGNNNRLLNCSSWERQGSVSDPSALAIQGQSEQ